MIFRQMWKSLWKSLFKKYGELFIRLNGLMETAKMFDGLYSFSFMLDSTLIALEKSRKLRRFFCLRLV